VRAADESPVSTFRLPMAKDCRIVGSAIKDYSVLAPAAADRMDGGKYKTSKPICAM